MKVRVVGNSCTWFTNPNTNYIINDEIILDTPQSSTKFMLPYIDYEKIKYIFITHFHSDHFTDLHLIYDWLKHRKNKEKVVVIGPKTLLKRFLKLYKLLEHPSFTKKKALKVFEFKEVKPMQKLTLDDFQVEVVKVEHNVSISFGYIFKFDNCKKTIGFSGDCCMCDGLEEIIDKSDTIFLDTSSEKVNKSHLSVSEALSLQKKYKNKTFYNVHITDIIAKKYGKKLNIPSSGELLEFK